MHNDDCKDENCSYFNCDKCDETWRCNDLNACPCNKCEWSIYEKADFMGNGSDSFLSSCSSPVSLTEKENEGEKCLGKLSKEQQELIRMIVDKFYSKYST